MINQIQALDWQVEPGNYQLASSNVSVTTTSEEYLLKGTEAHKYMRITEGHDGFKPDALIVRVDAPSQSTQVLFTYHNIGYVNYLALKDEACSCTPSVLMRSTHATLGIKSGFPGLTAYPLGGLTRLTKTPQKRGRLIVLTQHLSRITMLSSYPEVLNNASIF